MTRRRTKGQDDLTGDLFGNLDMPDVESKTEPGAAHETALQMLGVLDNWVERGWLRTLDAAFARFLWTEAPHSAPLLLLAAALASHQLGRGHVCLDLKATLEDPAFALSLPPDGPQVLAAVPAQPPAEVLAGVTLAQWRAALAAPDLVSEETAVTDAAEGNAPLVLVGTRLYLRRYWQYEQDVREGIERRFTRAAQLEAALPLDIARAALDALFVPRTAETRAAQAPRAADWQKLACALAARSAFSIVTGGPGTGKTTTVVRLLALLQTLALGRGGQGTPAARPLRIRLAAPTGKAAARLNESIAGAVERLPFDALQAHVDAVALRNAIPTVVTTLHRVLGTRPGSRRFRHDAANPLPVDVLVIDEASMVDLEMMAAVLDALPPSARLILLGDKDQLASVEAGAVLGELCDRAREGHYTQASRAWLETATGERIDAAMLDAHGLPLDQAIAMLRESHRFASESGIGALAELVNTGDAVGVAKIWSRGYEDLARLVCPADDDGPLRSLIVDGRVGEQGVAKRQGYRHYLETMRTTRPEPGATPEALSGWAAGVLKAHGAFQLLCALRRGPWGVEGLNRRVARLLHEEGLVDPHGDWYAGRPVLVTHNDYELGLMNGDIGIALDLPVAAGEPPVLRVAFPAGDGSGGVKWVSPSRLQGVETVFALTVHKSQGSEFTHAALVLPDTYSPILTRELVYTGITRARSFLTLALPEGRSVLDRAVLAKVQRASGLMAGLARDAQAA
ncbi:exodeoxyribonuclease V subunit alpha [Paraburkholderia flagellata]|uniref:exodeoxyribonuclease V subunit alpha n=1 Tax=Paraburkholderia flagellata TaxID=2883241 RepID=UPI001F1AC6F7|nr:exodeoxyribonuclease V subunit alpha [Paraburkholderia flagellata]